MMSPATWRAAGDFFEHRGQRIFFREGGVREAPALLLIHGFPTASWDWEQLWPELARHYRLLTLDMLGFGFSSKPHAHDYTIGGQADLFEALLARCGVHACHVLAHDYGDTVAQELLARRLDAGGSAASAQLLSVCFLNGGLFPETHRPLLLQRLLLSPVGPLFARMASERRLAASMTRIFGRDTPPSPALISAFWELASFNEGRRAVPRLMHYIPERRQRRERWVGALQRTGVPLKLIDGMADPISGAHMVWRYRELVPQADVAELRQIGHYPQIEAPRQVLDAYYEFRKRLER